MKLSTRSRYGTRMLLDIAMNGQDGPVRIKDISKRQGVSVKYLEKLIRPLKKGKFIKSKRGPKGGHMLDVEPRQITVGELVRLFEDELSLTRCVKEPDCCPITGDCYTRRVWLEASQAMYDKLDSITLQDLIDDALRSGKNPDACFPRRKAC